MLFLLSDFIIHHPVAAVIIENCMYASVYFGIHESEDPRIQKHRQNEYCLIKRGEINLTKLFSCSAGTALWLTTHFVGVM